MRPLAKTPRMEGKKREWHTEAYIAEQTRYSPARVGNGTASRRRAFADKGAPSTNGAPSAWKYSSQKYARGMTVMQLSEKLRAEEPEMTEDDSSNEEMELLRACHRFKGPDIGGGLEPKRALVTVGRYNRDIEAGLLDVWTVLNGFFMALLLVLLVLFLSVLLMKLCFLLY